MANSLSIGGALLLILAIDAIFFLGQTAIVNINPDSTLTYISAHEISVYDAGNRTISTSNSLNNLPSGNPTVDAGSDGGLFVDVFTAIWNFLGTIPGLNILFTILSGFTPFLAAIGLPPEFVFAVGAVWYGTTFFLLVAFITGRGGN